MPGGELEPLEIGQLLSSENTTEHFATLVRRYARAAVSGVVPKFIANDVEHDDLPLGKPTLRTGFHIIKGSDDTTPYLGFNEFYTMQVLERLQVVPVATCRMSEDGRVLVVDRFDVDENGQPRCGLEDACGLLGLPPHEKYATTTERVWNATRPYIPGDRLREQREHFGWHILANYVVRNADCHAKNIALYYTSRADVAFTPIYDLVTTQAYPRFASNPPGLSVGGRQSWTPGRTLEIFFNGVLGIPPRQYASMVEQLCESAIAVGKEVIEAAKNEPAWRDVAKPMVHAWNQGMETLRSPRAAPHFRGLDTAITEAGFSGPRAAESSRVQIGRSELLAPRKHK
jgi:serine/threonine-protein kinase HipA